MADKHAGEEVKGRLKEGAGDVTGNKRLKHEGEADVASAKTKRTVDKATEKVKKAIK